jgi:hypothetical protein
MNRMAASAAMILAAVSMALAHEGHHTKLMGTVRSMSEQQMVVRTANGKERTVLLDGDTKCVDRQGDTSCSDVKAGDRVVVVTRHGKDGQVVADEIKFRGGGGKAPAAEPAEGHQHHQHSDAEEHTK